MTGRGDGWRHSRHLRKNDATDDRAYRKLLQSDDQDVRGALGYAVNGRFPMRQLPLNHLFVRTVQFFPSPRPGKKQNELASCMFGPYFTPSECLAMNHKVLATFEQFRLTNRQKIKRTRLLKKIGAVLMTIVWHEECGPIVHEVTFYGSMTYDLCLMTSDMDIRAVISHECRYLFEKRDDDDEDDAIVLLENEEAVLKDFGKKLVAAGLLREWRVSKLPQKMVLRGVHSDSDGNEICIDLVIDLGNEHLVCRGLLVMGQQIGKSRFKCIGTFVKVWAESTGIRKTQDGYLSAYAWIILLISFNQQNEQESGQHENWDGPFIYFLEFLHYIVSLEERFYMIPFELVSIDGARKMSTDWDVVASVRLSSYNGRKFPIIFHEKQAVGVWDLQAYSWIAKIARDTITVLRGGRSDVEVVNQFVVDFHNRLPTTI